MWVFFFSVASFFCWFPPTPGPSLGRGRWDGLFLRQLVPLMGRVFCSPHPWGWFSVPPTPGPSLGRGRWDGSPWGWEGGMVVFASVGPSHGEGFLFPPPLTPPQGGVRGGMGWRGRVSVFQQDGAVAVDLCGVAAAEDVAVDVDVAG